MTDSNADNTEGLKSPDLERKSSRPTRPDHQDAVETAKSTSSAPQSADDPPDISLEFADASTELAQTRGLPVSTGAERMAKLAAIKTRGGQAHFTVVEELGSGGFGTVFRAIDTQLDREVAVKIIKSTAMANNSRLIHQFREEARAVAQLRHPNIVPVYHSGEFGDDETFIVFDFVPGRSLRQILRESGPLSIKEAVELTAKVADALGYAHSRGVVHLDVKPENILIEEQSGEPHVADFGCAKRVYREEDLADQISGRRVGTPSYFSPEQARKPIGRTDARSDVWALGIMLGELVTGRRAFRDMEQDRDQLFAAIRDGTPPLLSLRSAEVDRDIEAIFRRCLAKKPDDRYQNGWELRNDLRRWSEGRPVLARPVGVVERTIRWARLNPLVAASTAITFLALVAGLIGTLWALRAQRIGREERVQAQIDRLLTAPQDGVESVLGALEDSFLVDTALAKLNQRWESSQSEEAAGGELTRVALARCRLGKELPSDERKSLVRYLAAAVLNAPPDEQILIHKNLEDDSELLVARFASLAEESRNRPRQRLRALAGMLYHSGRAFRSQPFDIEVGEFLSLLQREVHTVGRFDENWVPLLQQIRYDMKPLLESFLVGPDSRTRRQEAAILYTLFAADQDYLSELLFKVDDAHVAALIDQLRPANLANDVLVSVDRSAELGFQSIASEDCPRAVVRHLSAEMELSRELSFDRLGEVLRRDRDGVDAPTIWAHFIQLAEPYGVTLETLQQLGEFAEEHDDNEMLKHCLLAMGEISRPAGVNNGSEIVTWLEGLFITHPDSGVHFGCDWLLRQWQIELPEDRIGANRYRQYSGDRTWRYEGDIPFVRIQPNHSEWIGVPEHERNRFPDEKDPLHADFDSRYQVEFRHHFEISNVEITH